MTANDTPTSIPTPYSDDAPKITVPAFTDGGTVLDRRDDKATFFYSDDADPGQPHGSAPSFEVMGLQKQTIFARSLTQGETGVQSWDLLEIDPAKSYSIVIKAYSGAATTLAAPAGTFDDLVSLVARLNLALDDQATAPISDIRIGSLAGAVSCIEVEWDAGAQYDFFAEVKSSGLISYVSPFGPGLYKFASSVDAQVETEGTSTVGASTHEKQFIALPTSIQAGSTYVLELPGSSTRISTGVLSDGTPERLLAALRSALGDYPPVELALSASNANLTIRWNYSGSRDGVARLGELVPIVPTPTGVANEWQISRADVEAAIDLIGMGPELGGLQIIAREAYDDDGHRDSSNPVTFVFPDTEVVNALRPEGVTSIGFAEQEAGIRFTVDLAKPVGTEVLQWQVLLRTPGEDQSPGFALATADDFNLTTGAVTVNGVTGSFVVPIKNDVLAENAEFFDIVVGHSEGEAFVADFRSGSLSYAIAPSDPAIVLGIGPSSWMPGASALHAAALGVEMYGLPGSATVLWTATGSDGMVVSLPRESMPYLGSMGGGEILVDRVNEVLLVAGVNDAESIGVTYDPDGAGSVYSPLQGEIFWVPPSSAGATLSVAPTNPLAAVPGLQLTATGGSPTVDTLRWYALVGGAAGQLEQSSVALNIPFSPDGLYALSALETSVGALEPGLSVVGVRAAWDNDGVPQTPAVYADYFLDALPPLPTVAITGPQSPVDERGAGAQFSVSLSGALPQGTELYWRVMSSGTNSALPQDFDVSPSTGDRYPEGILTFQAGSMIASATVDTFDDALVESQPETFTFQVGTRTGHEFLPLAQADASIAPSDEGGTGGGHLLPDWLNVVSRESGDPALRGMYFTPREGAGVATLKLQLLWADQSTDADFLPEIGPQLEGVLGTDGFLNPQSLVAAILMITQSQTAAVTVPVGVRLLGFDGSGVAVADKVFDFVQHVAMHPVAGLIHGARMFDEDMISRNPFSRFARGALAFSDSDGYAQLPYATGSTTVLTDQVAISLPTDLTGPGALAGVTLRADIVAGLNRGDLAIASDGDSLDFGHTNLFLIEDGNLFFLPDARYAAGTGAWTDQLETNAVKIGSVESDGADGRSLAVRFNADATPAQVDLLAAAIRFSTSLPMGTSSQAWESLSGQREISIALHDAMGDEIGQDSRLVEFQSVNDAPRINVQDAVHAGFNAVTANSAQSLWDYVGSGIARMGWRTGAWSVRDGDSPTGTLDLQGQYDFDVAVVGASGAGTWEYWSGTTALPTEFDPAGWRAIGGASDANALLLDGTTPVRFVPSPEFVAGAPALTLRVWDGTGVDAEGGPLQAGERIDVSGFLTQTMAGSGPTSDGLVFFGNVAQKYEYVRIWTDMNGNGEYDFGADSSWAVLTRPADAATEWSWRTTNPIAALDSASDLAGLRVSALDAAGASDLGVPAAISSPGVTIAGRDPIGWNLANLTIPFSFDTVIAEMPIPYRSIEARAGTNEIRIAFSGDIATADLTRLSQAFSVGIDPDFTDTNYSYQTVPVTLGRDGNHPDQLVLTLPAGVTLRSTDLVRIGYMPTIDSGELLLADAGLTQPAVAFEESYVMPYGSVLPDGPLVSATWLGAGTLVNRDDDYLRIAVSASDGLASLGDGSFSLVPSLLAHDLVTRIDGSPLYEPVADPIFADVSKTYDSGSNTTTFVHSLIVGAPLAAGTYQLGVDGLGPIRIDVTTDSSVGAMATDFQGEASGLHGLSELPFAISAVDNHTLKITWSGLGQSDRWPAELSTLANVRKLEPDSSGLISRPAIEAAIKVANYPNFDGTLNASVSERTDSDDGQPDTGMALASMPAALVQRVEGPGSIPEGGRQTFTAHFNQAIPVSEWQQLSWRVVDLTTSTSDFAQGGSGALTFSADARSASFELVTSVDAAAEPDEAFKIEVGSSWHGQFAPDMAAPYQVAIVDSGSPPTLPEVAIYGPDELAEGANATFIVQLSAQLPASTLLHWRVVATDTGGVPLPVPQDFVGSSGAAATEFPAGVLGFAANSLTTTQSIGAYVDASTEPQEAFMFEVGVMSAATFEPLVAYRSAIAASGPNVSGTIQGKVVDGYLAGATVFVDSNRNMQIDPGESWTTTALDGSYSLPAAQGPILAFGGFDVSTHQQFNGGLMALPGESTLTPLTTLVAAYFNAKRSGNAGFTLSQALQDVSQVTGVEPGLLKQDVYALAPSSAEALAAQKVSAQIATLIQSAVALYDDTQGDGPDASVMQGLAVGIVTKTEQALQASSRLELGSKSCIKDVLEAAAPEGVTTPANLDDVVAAVANLNSAIQAAPGSGAYGLESVVRLQAVLQSELLADIALGSLQQSDYEVSDIGGLAANQTIGPLFPRHVITGTENDDALRGTGGADDISGDDGDDVLWGEAGDDALAGYAGDDRMYGGDGNDRADAVYGGDLFVGGPDTDTAILVGTSSDYRVALATGEQFAVIQQISEGDAGAGFDPNLPLYAVQRKVGSDGIAFVQAEFFRFGDDSTVDPASLLTGQVVTVGQGGDYAGLSAAIAAAKDGDRITVLPNYTDASEIQVTRNGLNLELQGGGSALRFKLAEAPATTSQAAVQTLILSGTRDANVVGNAAQNTIVGNDGRNVIEGLGGDDALIGRGGNDDLQGGGGGDWLDGGSGWDSAYGGSGNDRLFVDEGGGAGSGAASDLLSGGSGNDLLFVANHDAGKVQMLGGSGADLYRFGSTNDGAGGNTPLDLDAIIADLTVSDGIDLTALRVGADGLAPTSVQTSPPVNGDLSIAFGPNSANANIEAIVPGQESSRCAVLGEIRVALADPASVNAAIVRAEASPFTDAYMFPSINALMAQLDPIYQGL